MPWSRRRRRALLSTAAVAIVVALFLPTSFAGWAPVLHWECVSSTRMWTGVSYVPIVLANSPFGGNVSAEGVIPASFPGGFGYPNDSSWETDSSSNGSASGTFNAVVLTVFQQASQLAWGPGANSPCSDSFTVVPSQPANPETIGGWTVGVPSNLSDSGEATSVVFQGFSGAPSSVLFENGYTAANEAAVSTCNSQAKTVPLPSNSHSLAVTVPFVSEGKNYTLPWNLPFTESYVYWFPGHFGIWQVDNLSAPGGPGGGWAFSYSPCP